ncbi:MAG TPA: BatD family protein [Candidatus Krumholzibacteria bacterium]|nr:BatD family protein [Candidatus Krumholzibacteria bacterium]
MRACALVMAATALLLTPSWVGAEDIAVRASVEPATVEVGGQVLLTVVVEGKFRRGGSPELPPLADFDVFESGTSQSFSFVNGQAHSSLTFNYVLSPRKEGNFRIEPIRYTLDDKVYTANAITLSVVAGGAGIAPPSGGGAASNRSEARGATPSSEESIFVTASVDRDTVFVNQQVTWSLGYYTDGRVELLRSPNYSPPSAEGFWVEDLPPQSKYYRTLHGRQYLVSEIKRGYFPTAPGTYKIGEARVDIVLDTMNRRNAFDDFFSRRGGFGEPRSLNTDPVSIVVLPLPVRGKPADFTGIVASDLAVSIVSDKQVVQVGEPINLSVEINGVGNMGTIAPPKLADLPQFKAYESGSSSDSFKKDYVVSGRRKFDYVMVPQVEGTFTIPGVRVAYFDPGLKLYQVSQSADIRVEVKPGTQEDGRKVIYAGGGDDFEVINRDVRFIHPVPANLTAASSRFYQSPMFFAAHALPLLALGLSMVVERKRRRLRSDVGFARASRALREAEKKLSDAERAFRAGQAEDGFGRVHAALFGYFADRANAPAAGLTSDDIEKYLRSSNASDDTVAAVREIVAACDAARYAAGAASAERGMQIAARSRDVIAALEKGRR